MIGQRFAAGFVVLLIAVLCFTAGAQTPEYRASSADGWHEGYTDASEVSTTLANLRAGNCNVFVPELRLFSDAYYAPVAAAYPDLGSAGTIVSNGVPITCDLNSDPEPRQNPSFDALAAILNQAHSTSGGRARIDVWAWLVSMRVRSTGALNTAHPSWLTKDDAGVVYSESSGTSNYFDPGHPGYEQQLVNVCLDLATRYDIDGLNLDYIRFTASNIGYNDVSIVRYNAINGKTGRPSTSDAAFKQWRRDQVTNLVRKIFLSVIAVKPNLRISADTITSTPVPVRPTASDPNPLQSWKSHFESSTAAYKSLYQDWRSWMEEGILDIAMPMDYFDECTDRAAFDVWSDFAKDNQFGRQCVVTAGDSNSLSDALSQFSRTRDGSSTMHKYGAGQNKYSYALPYALSCGGTYQADPPGWFGALKSGMYSQTAPVPPLPRLANGKGHLKGTLVNTQVPAPGWVDGGTVSITGPVSRTIKTDGTGFYGFVDLPPGTYSVTAAAQGVNNETKSVTISAYTVSNVDFALKTLVPTRLAFVREPSGASTDQVFPVQPMIAAEDESGIVVTTFTGPISVDIERGTGASGAVLNGSTTLNASSGTTTFGNLSIGRPGIGYVLTATSLGLTPAHSAAIAVVPAPTRLIVVTQPVAGVAGEAFTVQPSVCLQDNFGNLCSSSVASVTAAIKGGTGSSGAVLGGVTSLDTTQGVVGFTNLSIDKPGSGYVLVYSSDGLVGTQSSVFAVLPAATRLVIDTQPLGSTVGHPLATQPRVSIRDGAGNVCTWSKAPVSLSIMAGTGYPGAMLKGTTTVDAVNGVAAFSDLSVDRIGFAYRLTASSGALPPADTLAFDMATTAVKLAFSTQPGGAVAGKVLSSQPVVVAQNSTGGIAADYLGVSSIFIKDGTGASSAYLDGTVAVPFTNGVAAFTDLAISEPGTGYVLTASSGTLPDIDSEPIYVGGGRFELQDAVRALRISAGLEVATAEDGARLEFDGYARIGLRNAARIARKAMGLESNP